MSGSDLKLPVKVAPFDHQKKAFEFVLWLFGMMDGMVRSTGAALLMQMGTGKSFVSVAVVGWMFLHRRIKRLLVVCPLSITGVWQDEFSKYADFPFSLTVLSGTLPKKKKQLAELPEDGLQVVVVNYESAWRMEKELLAYRADMIICDEGHKLKEGRTAQSKGMHKLGDKAKYRMLLTGTVITNREIDVFSQYRFVAPQVFGSSFFAFRNRYFFMSGYGGHTPYFRKSMTDEFLKRMHSIAFRVRKDECLDLPEVTEEIRMVDLEPEAAKLYTQIEEESYAEMQDSEVTAANVLTRILRLSQITGGFLKDDDENVNQVSIKSGILATDVIGKEKLQDLGTFIMGYNEPEKTISILAWTAGCFIKPHLRKAGIKFPHLFLIGEAGSGKSTTLERVVLPVFSSNRVTAATQVTQFTLMKESASSNLIPMPLDEFKPSKIDKLKINALYNHFRDSYDGHEGLRGRADQSVVTYDLLAPLVVAGEESADEAAIRERSIELLFSKKDLKKPEYRDAFQRVAANEKLLQDFGRTILDMALSVRAAEVAKWHKEGVGKFSKELPSRVVNNLACCFAGLKLIESLCARAGLSFSDVFPFGFDACIRYLEHGAKEYLLDGGTNNQSVVEQTFEIMARMGLDGKTEYNLSDDKTKLFIRLSQVYDKYTKYRKDYAIVGEVLTYAQFKKQLMHSDVFLQHNVQHKFNGKNCKCWVINYQTLLEHCDVSGFDTEDGDEVKPLN